MNLPDIQRAAGQFVSQHSTTILTAGGVVGTVTTAVLTGRASFKAAEIMREEQATRQAALDEDLMKSDVHIFTPDLTKTEIVKLVWQEYIPPVVVGTATIASIVMANQMSAKRAAALAAAYGISENRLQEYKDKVSEKLTGPKKQQVDDEIAQDRVNNNPPKEVIILGGGDVLCFDAMTGRYFRSSYEAIKQAENKINGDLFHHQYASLSSFYEEIGLPPTTFSEHVGWNLAKDEMLNVKITTTQSPTNEPCLSIDFEAPPGPNYTQLY